MANPIQPSVVLLSNNPPRIATIAWNITGAIKNTNTNAPTIVQNIFNPPYNLYSLIL